MAASDAPPATAPAAVPLGPAGAVAAGPAALGAPSRVAEGADAAEADALALRRLRPRRSPRGPGRPRPERVARADRPTSSPAPRGVGAVRPGVGEGRALGTAGPWAEEADHPEGRRVARAPPRARRRGTGPSSALRARRSGGSGSEPGVAIAHLPLCPRRARDRRHAGCARRRAPDSAAGPPRRPVPSSRGGGSAARERTSAEASRLRSASVRSVSASSPAEARAHPCAARPSTTACASAARATPHTAAARLCRARAPGASGAPGRGREHEVPEHELRHVARRERDRRRPLDDLDPAVRAPHGHLSLGRREGQGSARCGPGRRRSRAGPGRGDGGEGADRDAFAVDSADGEDVVPPAEGEVDGEAGGLGARHGPAQTRGRGQGSASRDLRAAEEKTATAARRRSGRSP